jgi:hypothetical protein
VDDIVLTDRLVRQGFSRDEIGRLLRTGDLERIRRGAYRPAPDTPPTPTELHRQLIAATVPQLRADAVISHQSAAVLHSLPVWTADLASVHLTRPRSSGGGKKRSLVILHANPLGPADVAEVDGIPVTSLARTVFDIARTLPFDRAVAAGDRALVLGMPITLLSEMLDERRRWLGIGGARRVAGFIDGRAESPGESVSRVRCHEFGLPAPTPQLSVYRDTRCVARCDLGWEEFRTVGEFDGLVKYEELLKPDESASDVVIREKRREDLLRQLGWQVVRWVWSDLRRFGPVRDQLLAAFARGRLSA